MLGKELLPAIHGRVAPAAAAPPRWRQPPAGPSRSTLWRRRAPPGPPEYPRPDAAIAAVSVAGRRVEARERPPREDAATGADGRRRGRQTVTPPVLSPVSGGAAVVRVAAGGWPPSADFCGGALHGDGPGVERVLVAQRAELFVPVSRFHRGVSLLLLKLLTGLWGRGARALGEKDKKGASTEYCARERKHASILSGGEGERASRGERMLVCAPAY